MTENLQEIKENQEEELAICKDGGQRRQTKRPLSKGLKKIMRLAKECVGEERGNSRIREQPVGRL